MIWSRLKRFARALAALLALVAVAAGVTGRKVHGDTMAPNIRDGEWVFLAPLAPIRGDVVALKDPLDPSRTVLRRVIAGPRQKVTYEDGELRVEVKRIRQKEMGEDGVYRVTQETMWSKPPARANNWLLRLRKEPVQWKAPVVSVPEDHWYLLADNRDDGLDSRWWGPVAAADLLGVVRLRVGTADAWRSSWEVLDPIP